MKRSSSQATLADLGSSSPLETLVDRRHRLWWITNLTPVIGIKMQFMWQGRSDKQQKYMKKKVCHEVVFCAHEEESEEPSN